MSASAMFLFKKYKRQNQIKQNQIKKPKENETKLIKHEEQPIPKRKTDNSKTKSIYEYPLETAKQQ